MLRSLKLRLLRYRFDRKMVRIRDFRGPQTDAQIMVQLQALTLLQRINEMRVRS